MNFNEMQLNPKILQGLNEMGIHTPTDIQEKAIPKIIQSSHSHIIAQARTGSGKTLAFAIPIAEKINNKHENVQTVIIVPTRELCTQVAEVFASLTKYQKLSVVQVYGGVSIDRQVQRIQSGAQIVVATPGRLIDIYNRKRISFKHVKYVVLDEADRCLDMGFMPDIEFILLEAMKHVHPQLMLFSATMFTQVIELAQRFTKGKNIIEVNVSQDQLTVDNCDQFYYLINNFKDKYYDFVRILRQEKPTHSMIFVNTKKTGEWLYNRLSEESKLNLKIELISGNLSQKRREIVLKKFKSKKINCLIATDVAARGLDIQKVSHVFNYDIPEFEENYVHRIGRTARVFGGDHHIEKGTAISLVLADQMRIMGRIEAFMDKNIKQRPLPQRQGSNRQNYPNSGRQYNNGNGNYRSYNNRSNTNNPNQRNNQRRSPYPSNSPRNGPRRSDDPRNKLERSKDEKSKKEKPDPKRRNFLY